MGFLEKITGSDISREFKVFEDRIKKMPEDYQIAWRSIEENLWEHSDFTGRNLIPIFEGIIGLLEETATHGERVDTVLGGDIKGFCLELVGKDNTKSIHDKLRNKLNRKISKKLGK